MFHGKISANKCLPRRILSSIAIAGTAVASMAIVSGTTLGTPALADTHVGQSVNVAVIGSTNVGSGGQFPTTTAGPTGAFTDFAFTDVAPASVSAAALGAYDTVLLNVASPEMACSTATLTTGQLTDLVDFVADGKKLIIYDSECATQDYSWLPVPFMTNNPGQLGANGTLTIVENNTLSSNDPMDAHFIDEAMLGTQTDAVGDMNVMTTLDPNWNIDMSGTNATPVTGPVHTYANHGTPGSLGLIIYNGLDVDYMSSFSAPDSATPEGNLAKIWLQELQQPFNPDNLPGSVSVVGITLDPETATNPVGTSHTVTATLKDQLGVPQVGVVVAFAVVSGPNAGATGACSVNADCSTDATGQVSFTYTGAGGVGIDEIVASFTPAGGQPVSSRTVTKEWTQPAGPTCDGVPATIVGTDASEVIKGTSGNDVIVALGGNDVIHAGKGDDLVCAGNGADKVFGEHGNDVILGGDGPDVLKGGHGDDTLLGEAGKDVLIGGPGADYLVQ